MIKKSLKPFDVLSKLSKQEKQFKKELAETFLEYLDTLSLKKRIIEMESILFETEVKRFVSIDKRLSPQERKCMFLTYKGKSIKEIAKIFGISFPTVREYRNKAIKKLGVPNITAAVALGVKYNTIDPT